MEKTHLAFLLIAVVVVMGIAYAAALDPSLPYHSYSQIELPSGGATWTGLRAESADTADSVDWSGIQNAPDLGCILYENVYTVTCPDGMYIMGFAQTSYIGNGPCTETSNALKEVMFGHIGANMITCYANPSYGDKGNVVCCHASPVS